jgi:hypothetical protein
MMIKKRLIQLSLTGALAAGLVLSCGKDDKDDPVADPVADDDAVDDAGLDLKVVSGTVAKFETGPAYSVAATALNRAAADENQVYQLGAATDGVALTEWHVLTTTQDPASCASDTAITPAWDPAYLGWTVTVAAAKAQSEVQCTITVDVTMGETVPFSWVTTLLNTDMPLPDVLDVDGAATVTTKKCTQCHTASGNSKFAMFAENTTTFSHAVLVNNEESDDQDGAHSQMAGVFKAGLHEVGVDCSAVTGDGLDTTSDWTRIAPGDPYGSSIVGLTDLRYDDTLATLDLIKASAYAVWGREGKKIMKCSSSDLTARRYMPRDDYYNPPVSGKVDAAATVAWPADVHDKFARWVLQGALGT